MVAQSPNTPSGVNATGLPSLTLHPRLVELIEREQLRTRIEAAVTRLNEALDEIDDEPDLEDGGDDEAVNEDGDINDEALNEGDMSDAHTWEAAHA